MMFKKRRLHPLSALLHVGGLLKNAFFPLIVILFLNGGNIVKGNMGWMPLLIGGGIFGLVFVSGLIRWWRFTYRVEEGELRIEYGLIFRKKRYIPLERIQSLDHSEGIVHRPFGLVKLSIETAASSVGNAEAELTAIRLFEALELEALLVQAHKEESESLLIQGHEEKRNYLFRMDTKDIMLMAVTSGGAGVVLSGVAVFLSQATDILPMGWMYDQLIQWIRFGFFLAALLVFGVFVFAYGFSILLAFIRYAGFSVSLEGEDVIITRGLLEKKQITVPINRIQGIRVDENMLRQPIGYVSVTLISAGGTVDKGSEHKWNLFPLIKKKDLPAVLKSVLPEYQWNDVYNKAPKRGRRRYLITYTLFPLIGSAAVSIFFFPYGLLSMISFPLFLVLGDLAFRDAGWRIDNQQLTLRNRSWSRHTFLMKKHRIQSARITQTIFQKNADLGSVRCTLPSGQGPAVARCFHLDKDTAEEILTWYKPGYHNENR
ncbi:PH domain-containing protein [Halobacillus sp. KGW1]|uniref:PH domain-containing protein n=1 Tax=Halobacillus sp. KGW1 TaxID=1793726 RepID=UPI000782A68D|nr:PH domain-containing protein [Halobacillus sp. KGW1]